MRQSDARAGAAAFSWYLRRSSGLVSYPKSSDQKDLSMRCYVILWVSMLASLVLSPAALADTIFVDPTVAGSPGAYTYSYEIENQTSVGLLLFSLTVTGDVGTINAPTGWVTSTGIPAPGETLVEWISTDVPFDVPALGTLSGFSF